MEQQHSMHTIHVLWRGTKYMVEISSDSTLRDLGQKLLKLTEVKADTMRLIVPQFASKSSKMLHPFSDEDGLLDLQNISSFKDNKPIRMMGVSKNEVDEVLKNAKKNERIVGFDEEEKRLKQRMSSKSQGSLKLPEGPYVFCEFRTLQIPGIELNPPASEALKRMHKLAADPGIVAIMNKHRWRVGIMTEMAPIGYVGVSPKCILGFNKNHGEEISLRLRTDDLKGFRKYESIKKTLLHELAHMIYSEHDANFYALDKQLNEEAANLDWTRSRGFTLSGINYSQYHEEIDDVQDDFGVSQKLGGNMTHQLVNARASSVAAAYHRFNHSSDISSRVSQVSGESDPNDNSNYQNKLEPEPDESSYQKKLEPDPDESSNYQNKFESDPDDSSKNKNKLEPDPDESMGSRILESECEPRFSRSTVVQTELGSKEVQPVPATNSRLLEATKLYVEPDPDEMGSSSNGNITDTNHFSQGMQNLDGNICQRLVAEPDPDELGEKQKTLECGSVNGNNEADCLEAGLVTDQTHLRINCKKHDTNLGEEPMQIEPDPDESSKHEVDLSKMLVAEPDPDESSKHEVDLSKMLVAEPDPDESLKHEVDLSKMLVAEPDPDESSKHEVDLSKMLVAEPDPDESSKHEVDLSKMLVAEPDPDESSKHEVDLSKMLVAEPDPDESLIHEVDLSKMLVDEPDPLIHKVDLFKMLVAEPDPDESLIHGVDLSKMLVDEPDPDESLIHEVDLSKMLVDEPDPDDQEIQRIQDSVSVVCNRLREAIAKLLTEVQPSESSSVFQTLFKIVRNVIEHPNEMKYRKLRKANPIIQKNVANFKAALEILFLIGFIEDVLLDEIGKTETFLVLKRNDPGLLWLAKSTLEACYA